MRGGLEETSCRGNFLLAGPFKYDDFANEEVCLISAIGRRGSNRSRQQQGFKQTPVFCDTSMDRVRRWLVGFSPQKPDKRKLHMLLARH